MEVPSVDAPRWKRPKHPSIAKWVNELQHVRQQNPTQRSHGRAPPAYDGALELHAVKVVQKEPGIKHTIEITWFKENSKAGKVKQ